MTQAGRGWNFGYQPAPAATHEPFDVFNVRGDSVVNNREAFVGSVESVVGRYDFRTSSDAAGTNGKMLIRARDGVVIETVYYGTNRLHELAQRTLLTASDPEPIDVKLFILAALRQHEREVPLAGSESVRGVRPGF